MSSIVEIIDGDEGWTDVVLPDGALKSDKLQGLVGFQEYIHPTTTVEKKLKRKRKAADILFNSAETKTDKKKTKRKKKRKAKILDLVETTEKITNEDYQFKNNLNAWSRMNLAKPLLRAIDERGFTEPTEIQNATIAKGLNSKANILAAAETGSGKTLAYGIPLVQKINAHIEKWGDAPETMEQKVIGANDEIMDDKRNIFEKERIREGPLGLILCPTRELAVQVHDQLRDISKHTNVRTAVIIGGMSNEKQERVLSKVRPNIVVATPGRFWELQSQGQAFLQNLDMIKYLVIDEADRMAEKGHFAELGSIMTAIGQCQKFVFSATLTLTNKGSKRMELKNIKAETAESKLKRLMDILGFSKEHKSEVFDLSNKTMTAKKLTEFKVACSNEKEKDQWLYWLLHKKNGRAIVFVNAISCALRLNGLLSPLQMPIHSLHANLQQRQRLKHLDRFRSDKQAILIATDVAARGLDIPNVEMIVHFQFPKTAESYVHRSGRSARSGKEGEAIALLGTADYPSYKKVLNTLKKTDLTAFNRKPPPKNVAERLELATKIDKLSHEKKKKKVEKNWFKKQAELCDIELSDDGENSEEEAFVDGKTEREIQTLKSELNFLLRRSL